MESLSRLSPIRRVGLIVLVALCVLWALAGVFGARTPSAAAREESWEQAQRRWAARPFTHYRVVMQAPSWCRMDVEIQNQRVVNVFQNSCPSAPQSVDELFAIVKQL